VLVIPAIDLMGGQVVRLAEGRRERASVYDDDPAAVARRFCAQGATRLHVVDLDGAFAGRPAQVALVRAIGAAVAGRASLQVGGGVRSLADCAALVEAGAHGVVLGTAAVRDPELVRAACARFSGQILVAVDARDGRVAVDGWTQATEIGPEELATAAARAGASAILYTDIARDGLRTGPAVEATARLTRVLAPVPVIASGGVATTSDLRALAAAGVPQCVVGRALYEGAFGLAEAIAAGAGS
jgi:phosphoribosylformimino-5-aminoimidazole carboxamide ribotide isomerase